MVVAAAEGMSPSFASNIKQTEELIGFYSPWNHRKTIGFLTILGVKEVNEFAWIHFEAKFGDKTQVPLTIFIFTKSSILDAW